MFVEAVHGLADRLVSGRVTPDLYAIRSSDGDLIDFQPGDEFEEAGQVLDRAHLVAVANLMQTLRRRLGFEVDIEFAFDGHRLYALQVRPITTLEPIIESGAA
jgi:pyruvate,water dikinase